MVGLEKTTLAHYTIQHRLARGGMSEVYLAYDEHMQRFVAIKLVNSSERDYIKRFVQEMNALARLSHEHILPIIDYGEDGSWHYCVMPYIEAGTLRERLAKGPLTKEEAGIILVQLAAALQCIHDHGILHRDIKPANILLQNGQHVYLADFGLAKEIEEDCDITQTGCLIGTPEYMAPELADEPASISSDIYAMGILLYQMVTGKVPFKGNTPMAVYWKHIKEQPLRPSMLNPAISRDMEQVILRALEKDPQHRFKSAQAMAEAYQEAIKISNEEHTALMQAVQHPLDRGTIQTLLPSVQQMIPLLMMPHRRVQPAFITLIAVFFLLVIPFSLGFSIYNSHLMPEVPIALGASTQLVQKYSTLYEGPPHLGLQGTSTPATTLSTPVHASNTSQGYGGQSQDNNRHGHWHKHGHGHVHGD